MNTSEDIQKPKIIIIGCSESGGIYYENHKVYRSIWYAYRRYQVKIERWEKNSSVLDIIPWFSKFWDFCDKNLNILKAVMISNVEKCKL